MRDFHAARLSAVAGSWERDLTATGIAIESISAKVPGLAEPVMVGDVVPTALEAAPIALSKMVIEAPVLERLEGVVATTKALNHSTEPQAWHKIAKLRPDRGRLDERSIALMQRKLACAGNDCKLDGADFAELVETFQQSVAEDTVRNEYSLHTRVHEWFTRGHAATLDADALTDRVYAELFLTPSDDPWLGLAPDDGYAALDGNGLRRQSRQF